MCVYIGRIDVFKIWENVCIDNLIDGDLIDYKLIVG